MKLKSTGGFKQPEWPPCTYDLGNNSDNVSLHLGPNELRPGHPGEEAGGVRRPLPLRERVHPGRLPLHLRPRQARHDQHARGDVQEQESQ